MREARCVTTMSTWPVSSMDSVAGPLPLEPEAQVSAPAPSETDPPSHTSAPPNDAPGYLDDLDEVDNTVPQWQPRQEFSESTPSLTSTELFEEEQNRIALREWEEGIYQLKMAFQLIIIPFFGRWVGRRWSYWGTWTNTGAAFQN